MDRNQKAQFVTDLNGRLAKAGSVVVAHYRGLTVKQLTTLRRELGKEGGEVKVTKNRLAKLAIKGTKFEGLGALMVGPTLMAFGEDLVAPSRISQKFADANEAMIIIGGSMDGKTLSKDEVLALSKLPSLDGIRGKLIGILQAPAAQIARVLQAHAEKGGVVAAPKSEEAAPAAAEAAAPAEAPAAEAPAAEAPATPETNA